MPESESRNSPLREKSAKFITSCAAGIYHGVDNLTGGKIKVTPDMLTLAGVAGVAALAKHVEELNKTTRVEDSVAERWSLGGAFGVVTIGDMLDGSLHRYLKATAGRKDTSYGEIADVIADRTQEYIMAKSRALSARRRGDKIGAALAWATAATSAVPSIVRAASEGFRNRVVAENGNNPVEMLGTRPGRAVLGGIGTFCPEGWGIKFQNLMDGTQVTANTLSAKARVETMINGQEANLTSAQRKESRKRFVALAAFQGFVLYDIYRHIKSK